MLHDPCSNEDALFENSAVDHIYTVYTPMSQGTMNINTVMVSPIRISV